MSSTPGWYPDPAGQPGHYRHWDGQQWSAQTTTDPARAGAPTGGATPPPGRKDRGRGTLLVILAALVVLGLLVWALLRPSGTGSSSVPEDTNSASPTGPVWNEKSASPSPGSSAPNPSNGAAVSCPTGGGNVIPASGSTLTSTGLTVNRIDGWDQEPSFDLQAIHDVQVQLLLVYQGVTSGWLSGQAVGRLANGDGFTDPETSAHQIMSCFATSAYYKGYTGREDLTDESVTIDGHKGWHLRSNIRVDDPSLPDIPGDRMDIVVVDTGQSGSLAVYAGWATIGDSSREQLVDQAITTLHVG